MTTIEATRDLRRETGESQQIFATRLGLSIRAIANYEKDREPSGRALAALAHAAQLAGRHDLEQVFAAALVKELYLPKNWLSARYQRQDDGSHSGYLIMHVDGHDRAWFAIAFARAMNLSYSDDSKVREDATKLLSDFQTKVRDLQKKYGRSK